MNKAGAMRGEEIFVEIKNPPAGALAVG